MTPAVPRSLGQASVLLVGALAALLVGVLVLGAVARGVAREAAAQRAVDLSALAGARAMDEGRYPGSDMPNFWGAAPHPACRPFASAAASVRG